MDALANIVKKSGTVVIGYSFVDGPFYDKDPDFNLTKLMKKYLNMYNGLNGQKILIITVLYAGRVRFF